MSSEIDLFSTGRRPNTHHAADRLKQRYGINATHHEWQQAVLDIRQGRSIVVWPNCHSVQIAGQTVKLICLGGVILTALPANATEPARPRKVERTPYDQYEQPEIPDMPFWGIRN